MRTLKFAAIAAFFSSLALLAGCASTGAADTSVVPTVANFSATAQKVCNVAQPVALGVQSTMARLTTPLDASDVQNIQKAIDDVNAFCAASAVVSVPDVQTLVNTMFPLLAGVVENSSLSANGKNLAIIGLGVAQTAIIILVPSVTPSSAPVSTTSQAQ